MPLPKIQHPTTNVLIPSMNKTVRIRPFTVKEEKLLLMAREDKEASLATVIQAVTQILTNCIVDDVNVEDLTLFDFEWLFMQLRSISVNNVIEFEVATDDGKTMPMAIDIKDIQLTPLNETVIDIGGDIKVTMSYLKIKDLSALGDLDSKADNEALARILWLTIVNMYDSEKIYVKGEDFDEKDLVEFVDNLASGSRDKIIEFFQNAPTLKHTIEYESSPGNTKTLTLSGLVDFFTLAPVTAT